MIVKIKNKVLCIIKFEFYSLVVIDFVRYMYMNCLIFDFLREIVYCVI